MPTPRASENKDDFIDRCMEELIEEEDREPDQARAMCENYWKQR